VQAAAAGVDAIIYLVGVNYWQFEFHPRLMRQTLSIRSCARWWKCTISSPIPVLMDDSALRELLGSIHKTPHSEGVRECLATLRASHSLRTSTPGESKTIFDLALEQVKGEMLWPILQCAPRDWPLFPKDVLNAIEPADRWMVESVSRPAAPSSASCRVGQRRFRHCHSRHVGYAIDHGSAWRRTTARYRSAMSAPLPGRADEVARRLGAMACVG
jgi:hypothetical protein